MTPHSISRAASALLLVVALVVLASARLVLGHDSPEHVIDILTARIEADPARADLRWRRATELRALGRLDEAARDLKKALQLQKDYYAAMLDLARIQLAQGAKRGALATVERGLAQAGDNAARASFRMLRAEIRSQCGQEAKALEDCQWALQHNPNVELDWYLTRSELQSRLGRFREAAQGLKEGFERTGSAVLEVESIEAMIDAAQFSEALAQIEPLLADCRWRSSWLIRRARVRLGQGDITAAQTDLSAAIQELNSRMRGTQPESGLLADRALAFALLGEVEPARQDFARAKKLGADGAMLWRVHNLLRSNPLASSKSNAQ